MKRKCSMCGKYAEESEFRYMAKQKRYNCYCKDCERLYNKEYMRIYRERLKTKERNKNMGHDLDEEELRATRRMFGLDRKENKVISREYVEENYINKDKIREKMKYYQELYKQDNSPNNFLINQDCLSKLSILQELLGE